jgi:hypothetical protein
MCCCQIFDRCLKILTVIKCQFVSIHCLIV